MAAPSAPLGAVLTGFNSDLLCLYRLNIDRVDGDAHSMTLHGDTKNRRA